MSNRHYAFWLAATLVLGGLTTGSGLADLRDLGQAEFSSAEFSTLSIGRHAVQKIYLGELEADDKKSQAFIRRLDQVLSAQGFVVVSLRQNADVLLTGVLENGDGPPPILKLKRTNGEELMHMEFPGEVNCSGRCQSKTAAQIARNIKEHWKEGQVFPE